MAEILHTKTIQEGKWQTIETFWNSKEQLRFVYAASARIRIRYGFGPLGCNSSETIITPTSSDTISIGAASVFFARVQILATQNSNIGYIIYNIKADSKFSL